MSCAQSSQIRTNFQKCSTVASCYSYVKEKQSNVGNSIGIESFVRCTKVDLKKIRESYFNLIKARKTTSMRSEKDFRRIFAFNLHYLLILAQEVSHAGDDN